MLSAFVRPILLLAALSAVHGSASDGPERLNKRLSAAACASTNLKNNGFENGLTSWNFSAPSASPGTVTCAVSSPGSGSAHSALLTTTSNPGNPASSGTISQTFKGCQNVNYTISWSLYQVVGKTTYDPSEAASPNTMLQFQLMSPDGWGLPIASYQFSQTNFTEHYTRQTYQAGTWVSLNATGGLPSTGTYALQFISSAAASSSDQLASSFQARIDNVSVKVVKA